MALLLFAAYLAAEIAALIVVGNAIGAVWTVLLLIAGSVVGMVLVRSQGRRVLSGLRSAARGERTPDGPVADGVLVALGAVLMFVPGLVTSVLGLLLLLPPTRFALRPLAVRIVARKYATLASGIRLDGTSVDGTVVDGTVVGQWYEPDPYARPQTAISMVKYIDERPGSTPTSGF